ncbi:unnamed protein product [Symbiodinium necroappetens]|uniref:t-SNARE coiled-coil homology domain-containing protein n=1 Tax=Symbiodinium necroappetens TaxID=1628268 RepID=A0A812Y5N0_9DINO|nr:unnamed protein product [Symbiodinium necroappetens]
MWRLPKTSLNASGVANQSRSRDISDSEDLHHDIARDIGQQVEVMILDAKHASETKVGKEITKIKGKMEAMAEKIKMINERVAGIEPGRNGLLKAWPEHAIASFSGWEQRIP